MKQLLIILSLISTLVLCPKPLTAIALAPNQTAVLETSIFIPLIQDNRLDVEAVISEGGIVLELGEGADTERILVESPGSFDISCPASVVCDGNFDYRAHNYNGDYAYLYISFDPQIVNNYSLASFTEYFNYLDLRIKFPERQTANSNVYFAHLDPLRALGEEVQLLHTDGMSLDLLAYENSYLRGTAQGVMTVLTTYTESEDPDCFTGDVGGFCYESEPAYIPFTLHFNLLVDEN